MFRKAILYKNVVRLEFSHDGRVPMPLSVTIPIENAQELLGDVGKLLAEAKAQGWITQGPPTA